MVEKQALQSGFRITFSKCPSVTFTAEVQQELAEAE